MTDGEARLAGESEHWRTLDRFFARLEGDMREAVPRASRHGGSVEPAWWAQAADSAGNTALVFTRAGPDFAIEPGIAGQRIGYRLAGDRVEIVYWPQLDNVDDARATAFALIAGVRGFRVSQLGAANRWLPRWPQGGDTGVPRAVHVELDLADGTTIDRVIVLR
jgi:type II secretion system protein J